MFVCPDCSTEYSNNGVSFCPKDGKKLTHKSDTNKLLSASPNILSQPTMRMLGTSERFEIKIEIDLISVPMKYKVFDRELELDAYVLVYPKRVANYINIEKAKKIIKLSHSNLVKPITFSETREGDIHVAYEFINGIVLEELLAKRELPELTVIKIGRQLTQCITVFHKQNLFHTNLHPGNIIVEQDGTDNGQVQIKVLNSLSSWNSEIRDAIERRTDITVTLQTKIMRDYRKIRYQRPDPGEVGSIGDIYAVGMILAEMMLGKAFPSKKLDLPYEYTRKPEIVDEALVDIAPRLPTGFRELVGKCLNADSKKTYQNASELLNDLISMERSTSLYVTNPINTSNSQPPHNHSGTQATTNGTTPIDSKRKFFSNIPRVFTITPLVALIAVISYFGINGIMGTPTEHIGQVPSPLPSPSPSPNLETTVCSEKSASKIQQWYVDGKQAMGKGIVLDPPENSAKFYYDNINQECPTHPLRQKLEDEMVLFYISKGDLFQSRGDKKNACFWYNRGSIISKNNDLVKEKLKDCQ